MTGDKRWMIAAFLLWVIVAFSCKGIEGEGDNCRSRDIEQIDSCLMGKTIGQAIENLEIDTSQFWTIDEPPGVLRGIYIQWGDSCTASLYVSRHMMNRAEMMGEFRLEYLTIKNDKIIGVCWHKRKLRKQNCIGSFVGYYE